MELAISRSTKKTLRFTKEEIEELLDSRYGRRTTALVLSLLYPGARLTDLYHQDHVVPRSVLRESRLKGEGLSELDMQAIAARRDRVPNLQLLPAPQNVEKSKKSLREYLYTIKPLSKRQHYLDFHDIVFVPKDVTEFLRFYEARREVMRQRLQHELS